MPNNHGDKDYEVGYGKPPVATQFKKGQSGNPKGRPKGTKNLATDIREEVSQQLSINEGGSHQVISKQRALVKALVAKALSGDVRAMLEMIKLISGIEQTEKIISAESDQQHSNEADREILEAYLQDYLANKPSS